MGALAHDLRHAGRVARRHPGFSAVVAATMALGIGLNTAVFGLLSALLLRPPPVRAFGRLAHVYSSVPGDLLSHAPMAFPDYESVRDATPSFAAVAAYAWYPLALEHGDASLLWMGEAVTGSYFATLGVVPALGRPLGDADDRPGAASAVAVLSHDAWRRHLGGAADVIGRELRLNGRSFTVVGVAPADFRSLIPGFAPDVWLPLQAAVALPTGVTMTFGGVTPGIERTADRAQRWVWVIGRLRAGASVEQAAAELTVLGSRLARDFPATNARRALAVAAAADVRLSPGLDGPLWAGSLLVMGVFVAALLLASVNLASLFLARALGRRREIATRLAMGASRRRLVRQLFLEGLLLALAGSGPGLLLAAVSNHLLARIDLRVPAAGGWPLSLVLAPAIDLRLLAFAGAAAVLTSVLFALLPALEATRSDLAGMLRQAGAGSSGRSSRRMRAALVSAQVAVSVVLLAGGGIALRSLLRASRLDPGFDPGRAAVATLSPDLVGYEWRDRERLFAELRARVAELPDVRSAALASHLPLTAALNFGNVTPEDGGAGTREVPVDFASVGPGYFETMGIALVAGRPFSEGDSAAAPRVVVVNETLARRLWPAASPLGRRLRDGGAEVIGVARDAPYRTLGEAPRPFLYTSLAQDPRGTCTLVARTEGDPQVVLPAVRRIIRQLAPRVPVSGVRTLEETVADALLLPRAAAALLGGFGALGLLLSGAGIFGVVAYLASAGVPEIGLRLALGATPGAILRGLLRRGLAPVVAGVAIGIIAAACVTWALSGVLPGVRAFDLEALAAAASLLMVVALAAALAPARWAARIDPAAALRQE